MLILGINLVSNSAVRLLIVSAWYEYITSVLKPLAQSFYGFSGPVKLVWISKVWNVLESGTFERMSAHTWTYLDTDLRRGHRDLPPYIMPLGGDRRSGPVCCGTQIIVYRPRNWTSGPNLHLSLRHFYTTFVFQLAFSCCLDGPWEMLLKLFNWSWLLCFKLLKVLLIKFKYIHY